MMRKGDWVFHANPHGKRLALVLGFVKSLRHDGRSHARAIIVHALDAQDNYIDDENYPRDATVRL